MYMPHIRTVSVAKMSKVPADRVYHHVTIDGEAKDGEF